MTFNVTSLRWRIPSRLEQVQTWTMNQEPTGLKVNIFLEYCLKWSFSRPQIKKTKKKQNSLELANCKATVTLTQQNFQRPIYFFRIVCCLLWNMPTSFEWKVKVWRRRALFFVVVVVVFLFCFLFVFFLFFFFFVFFFFSAVSKPTTLIICVVFDVVAIHVERTVCMAKSHISHSSVLLPVGIITTHNFQKNMSLLN